MGRVGTDDGDGQGDDPADLVVRCAPDLHRFVRRYFGGPSAGRESVSDVVQSVCREVLAHGEVFDHGGEVGMRKWMRRVARRKLVDRHRLATARRRDAGREELGGDVSFVSTVASPSRTAAMREELGATLTAFDALPEHVRDAILLSRVEGLPYSEIAARLGRSEGAVRNLVYRGLAKLSEGLDG